MIKTSIETVLAAARFKMGALLGAIWSLLEDDPKFGVHLTAIKKQLSEKDYKLLKSAILRNAFLIEPVLTKGGSTRMTFRWLPALENDQRFCTFEECLEIAADLIEVLATTWLNDPERLETLQLSLNHQMISHEASFDYQILIAPDDFTTRIHRRGNLVWIATANTIRALKLRKFLTNSQTSPDQVF